MISISSHATVKQSNNLLKIWSEISHTALLVICYICKYFKIKLYFSKLLSSYPVCHITQTISLPEVLKGIYQRKELIKDVFLQQNVAQFIVLLFCS